MIRRFLSATTPFVLLSLMAAEQGAGTGSSASDDAKQPEPTGSTLEEKLQSAGQIIKDLWGKLTKSSADLTAANDLLTADRSFEPQFKAEQADHKKTKDLLDKANGDLTTMTSARDGEKTRADKAATDRTRIEAYLKSLGHDLTGVDRFHAVKENGGQSGEGDNSPAALWDKSQQIRKDEADGKVDPGTYNKFLKEHNTALRAHAKAQR